MCIIINKIVAKIGIVPYFLFGRKDTKIKAAVLGATGYAGIELVRLLTSHPEVSIEILGSHSFAGQKISDVYKNFNSCT